MTTMRIKDVPAEVRAELSRRVALAGWSLPEYLRALLEEQVRHPDLDELLGTVGGRSGGHVPFAAAVAAIRQNRDGH